MVTGEVFVSIEWEASIVGRTTLKQPSLLPDKYAEIYELLAKLVHLCSCVPERCRLDC
jgi:hypothetical protein